MHHNYWSLQNMKDTLLIEIPKDATVETEDQEDGSRVVIIKFVQDYKGKTEIRTLEFGRED